MGVFLIIGFLSLTGIPPFGTFYSELMILNAAIQSGHYFTAMMLVVFLSIIFIGMAQAFLHMFHKGPSQEAPKVIQQVACLMPVFILGLVIIGLGLHVPQALRDVLKASLTILG